LSRSRYDLDLTDAQTCYVIDDREAAGSEKCIIEIHPTHLSP
jgi:hypothetical protein